MRKILEKDKLLKKYPYLEKQMMKYKINFENLQEIYIDYINYKNSYENQASFIANILRSQSMVHSVKSRIKDPERLIEKNNKKDRRSKK